MEWVEILEDGSDDGDEETLTTKEQTALSQLPWIVRAYKYFLNVGTPGTEEALIWVLERGGSQTMAVNYLNCGNAKLEKAAEAWAKEHGYILLKQPTFGGGSSGPHWGSAD